MSVKSHILKNAKLKSSHIYYGLTSFLLSLVVVSTSWARPALLTSEKVEGDASVILKLEEQFIVDDSSVPCEMIVEVLGEERPLAEGDTIDIFLNEDDTPVIDFGDDNLWSTEVVVDAQMVADQRFYQVYDCSFEAVEDLIGGLEVYAKVKVDKADCGTTCELNPLQGEDTPATSTIRMLDMIDDLSEDDDNVADAFLLPRTGVTDRIATDSDWLKVTYNNPVEFLARLESNFNGGDLNLTMYNSEMSVIGEAVLEANGGAKRLSPSSAVLPGEYYLEVTLADPANFNFYDLIITESQITTECAPGAVESRPCMRCGTEDKLCSSEGEWGEWGQCDDMGVCDPGMEESQGCGDGGNQTRSCNDSCQWDAYSTCIQCDDGATETCYSGPQELAGVGACITGARMCSRGQWSSCQGDIRPTIESCSDGIDNDCDGLTDSNDPECVAQLGDACTSTSCGAPFTCLPPPFVEGYCGGDDCSQCGVGSVCGVSFGKEYCLKPCAGFTDCRFGYICAPVGTMEEQVCVPPCESDEACGAGMTCNEEQYCVNSNGVATVSGPPVSDDEGCEQAPNHHQTFYLLMLLAIIFIPRQKRSVDH